MDLRLQPYLLPTGAKLQSDQFVFDNDTEDFLSVQVNAERTTFTNWNDKILFFNGGSVFFANLFGLPLDGTAILGLDIRTVSDAATVPEPHIATLTLIGALCVAVGRNRRQKFSARASLPAGSRSSSGAC
jgi:hypothetical protein